MLLVRLRVFNVLHSLCIKKMYCNAATLIFNSKKANCKIIALYDDFLRN